MAMTYLDAKKDCGFMVSGSEEPKAIAKPLSPDQISLIVKHVIDDIVIR